MIDIEGTNYKLMLIDTNVIREVVKNNMRERETLLDIMACENVLPCISIISLFEIRKRPDIFDRFLDVFSVVPFLLIKPQNQVFEEELREYPNPKAKSIIAFSFSPFNLDPNANTKVFLSKLFSERDVVRVETKWEKHGKKESLKSILSLKKNFVPRTGGANISDAKRFVQGSLPQYVGLTAPRWMSKNKQIFLNLNPDAFPSIQVMLLNVYYCFYDDTRRWEENDIFDILINSTVAYMDIIIAERFQAEVMRKVKKTLELVSHLQVESVGFLRYPESCVQTT